MTADLTLARQLADATHLAVLATTRPDGTVHASLVSAGVLEDPISAAPSVGVVVAGAARKLVHLRRAGRAAAVFSSGYRWVAVEGPVRIIGPDDPVEGFATHDLPGVLRAVFVAAGGSHDDWDEYDRTMAAERRAAVFIHADRMTTNPAP